MNSTSKLSTRVVGSMRSIGDDRGAIRMEDVYDTDVDDLWSALTDPRRLERWIVTVEGDLRVGGHIHARFTSTWEGPGRIDICDAPHRLLVTMEPGPSEAVIEAVLTPVGDKTRLVIEHRGLPLGEVPDHAAGWQAHLEDLTAYLGGRDRADWKARWTELTPLYREHASDLG
jgi:uncharacterized protein YndB with AHSA1/START domain